MKDQQIYDVLFTFTENGRSGMTYVATAEATDEYNAVYLASYEFRSMYQVTYENGYTRLEVDDVRVDSVTLIEEPK